MFQCRKSNNLNYEIYLLLNIECNYCKYIITIFCFNENSNRKFENSIRISLKILLKKISIRLEYRQEYRKKNSTRLEYR